MAEAHAERRLAAILAADVVGYSRLIEQDEAANSREQGDAGDREHPPRRRQILARDCRRT